MDELNCLKIYFLFIIFFFSPFVTWDSKFDLYYLKARELINVFFFNYLI